MSPSSPSGELRRSPLTLKDTRRKEIERQSTLGTEPSWFGLDWCRNADRERRKESVLQKHTKPTYNFPVPFASSFMCFHPLPAFNIFQSGLAHIGIATRPACWDLFLLLMEGDNASQLAPHFEGHSCGAGGYAWAKKRQGMVGIAGSKELGLTMAQNDTRHHKTKIPCVEFSMGRLASSCLALGDKSNVIHLLKCFLEKQRSIMNHQFLENLRCHPASLRAASS